MKPGGDGSSTVVKKMLECLRFNLDAVDFRYMKESVASSIAVDKGDEHLVVYARCLHPRGIYDFLVGIDDNAVPDTWSEADASRAVLKALKGTVQRACTKRLASKRTESIYCSPGDALCEDTFKSFCASVVSLQADGGPTEQRALFEAAPPPKKLAGARDSREVLFPNVLMISRDRAHRCSSIDKGFWSALPNTYQEFLAKLVTGDRSFARRVQTSQKFRNLFERMQTEEPCEGFSKVLKIAASQITASTVARSHCFASSSWFPWPFVAWKRYAPSARPLMLQKRRGLPSSFVILKGMRATTGWWVQQWQPIVCC